MPRASISCIFLVLLGSRVGALESQLQNDFLDLMLRSFPKTNVYFHSLNVGQEEILKSKDVIRTSEPSFYDKSEIQIRRNVYIFACNNQDELISLFKKRRSMFQFKENIFIVFVNFELTQNLTQIKRLVNKRYLLIVNQVQDFLRFFTIYEYHKESPNPVLSSLGIWKRGLKIPSEPELFPEKYCNFHGRTFKISGNLETKAGPLVVKRNENGEDEYSGTYHAIMQMHARKRNFKLKYVLKHYNTTEEIMSDVEKELGDLAIVMSRTVSTNRRFDFSYGPLFEFAGTTFYTQIPILQASFLGPVSPFRPWVWILILGTLAMFILVYVIINYKNSDDLVWSGIKLAGILIGKESFKSFKYRQKTSTLMIFSIWTIFCLLLGLIYTSVLITYLTMPRFSYVPETWEELLESDYTIYFPKGGNFREAFESSDENSIFGQVYKKVQSQRDEDATFDLGFGAVLNIARKIFLLPKNKKAMIWYKLMILQNIFTLPNGKQVFHMSQDVKDLSTGGHMMRKNSPYSENFVQFDLEMNNMGMLQLFRNLHSYGQSHPVSDEELDPLDQVTFGLKSLIVEHFYGPLVLWALGLFLALVAFVYELVCKRYENGIKNDCF